MNENIITYVSLQMNYCKCNLIFILCYELKNDHIAILGRSEARRRDGGTRQPEEACVAEEWDVIKAAAHRRRTGRANHSLSLVRCGAERGRGGLPRGSCQVAGVRTGALKPADSQILRWQLGIATGVRGPCLEGADQFFVRVSYDRCRRLFLFLAIFQNL